MINGVCEICAFCFGHYAASQLISNGDIVHFINVATWIHPTRDFCPKLVCQLAVMLQALRPLHRSHLFFCFQIKQQHNTKLAAETCEPLSPECVFLRVRPRRLRVSFLHLCFHIHMLYVCNPPLPPPTDSRQTTPQTITTMYVRARCFASERLGGSRDARPA